MSISKRLRFEILNRDAFTCRYCGRKAPDVALEVDHVYPRSKGGGDHPDNLVTACYACNRGKWADVILVECRQEQSNDVIGPECWELNLDDDSLDFPYWWHPEFVRPIPWSNERVEIDIVGLAPSLRRYTMSPDVCASIATAFDPDLESYA